MNSVYTAMYMKHIKQQAHIYLHFYVANLINCTNDGSPNHGWEYVCWKVGPCIATLNKLKDKKKYSTVKNISQVISMSGGRKKCVFQSQCSICTAL
jgi:hypothetical protein